jgi:hypothetical protein
MPVDAVVMNRAAVTHRADLLLFLWLFAHGLVCREDFTPILFGRFHRIDFALAFRTIRVSRFAAKSRGCEEQPAATSSAFL